ncbi:MAG: adenylate kinase [Dehalococcoidales bacterium]|nr:adenylate kinase [Dehalococcoidales bacterium]
MNIILLGAPGAGKGTQAAYVAKRLNLAYIATGDLFRKAVEQGTELGKQAKYYMEEGKLCPDEITIGMLLERLANPDCQTGVVFDGFPRNLNQAEALDKALAQQSQGIDKVVYIKVSEEELLRRLSGRWVCRNCQAPYHITDFPPQIQGRCDKCGGELYQRPDDATPTVKKRLKVYLAATAPLIDYYTRLGKLVEVDGEGKAEKVAKRIIKALGKGDAVS